MYVISHFLGQATTPIDTIMSVLSFMYGPIMTYHADAGRTGPEVILLDYLPQDLKSLDDAELSQVFEEACMMALSASPYDPVAFRTVDRVQVEPGDLPELKSIFGLNEDLELGIQFPYPEEEALAL